LVVRVSLNNDFLCLLIIDTRVPLALQDLSCENQKIGTNYAKFLGWANHVNSDLKTQIF